MRGLRISALAAALSAYGLVAILVGLTGTTGCAYDLGGRPAPAGSNWALLLGFALGIAGIVETVRGDGPRRAVSIWLAIGAVVAPVVGAFILFGSYACWE
jgi:hypothetical protein